MHDLDVGAGSIHRRPLRDNRPSLDHRASIGARIEPDIVRWRQQFTVGGVPAIPTALT